MEFRILGPLEVVENGRPLPLGKSKERVVLAVLLLHANEFVSRERLIDEIWGVAPPPTARKAVNVYVSKLRKTLSRSGHDPVATADGGYRLVLDPDLVDAKRVQRLVARADEYVAAGDSSTASQLLEDALALWRGPTLAGLTLESVGRDEVAQLDEIRLAALMDRIDCDLAQGRQERVLGELQVLVREHPLRERLRAQQMLALYRADRQADALEAFRQARHHLIDELGIEPSESLQRLQQAILQHDPALEAPTGTAGVNGSVPSIAPPPDEGVRARAPRQRFRSRPRRLALAALVAGAVSAAAILVASSSSAAPPQIVPNSLVRLDPRSGKIVSVVRVGDGPGSIAITPAAIWTANSGDRTVSRYDVHTHRVQSRGGIGSYPYDIAADTAGNVWVSDRAATIKRLAAGSAGTSPAGTLHFSPASTIALPPPGGAGSLALGGGYLWVVAGPLTLPGDNRVFQVNLATGVPVRTLRLKGDTTAVAFGDGAAWVSTDDGGNGLLYAIRAGAARPRSYRIELGDSTFGMSFGEGRLWLLTWGTNGGVGAGSLQQVLQVDPHTGGVVSRTTFDGQDLWALSAGGGSVWVLADASVIQLDARSGHVIRTIPLRNGKRATTCGIAAANGGVWVTMGPRGGKCSTGSA